MKIRTFLGFSAALLLVSMNSFGQERGFYVGADLGQGSVDSDRRGLDNSLVAAFNEFGVDVLDGTSEVSEDGFTWGLILGYQILPYLAVEAAYIDFGKFEYKARGTLTDGVSVTDGTFRLNASNKGPALSALGILPFGDGFSVFGRVGVAFSSIDYDVQLTVGDESASARPSGNSQNFLWGAGIGYTASQWTTRLEYQQVNDVGDNDVAGKADVSRIVLGAVYHF